MACLYARASDFVLPRVLEVIAGVVLNTFEGPPLVLQVVAVRTSDLIIGRALEVALVVFVVPRSCRARPIPLVTVLIHRELRKRGSRRGRSRSPRSSHDHFEDGLTRPSLG